MSIQHISAPIYRVANPTRAVDARRHVSWWRKVSAVMAQAASYAEANEWSRPAPDPRMSTR